jgi:hypothetical protein
VSSRRMRLLLRDNHDEVAWEGPGPGSRLQACVWPGRYRSGPGASRSGGTGGAAASPGGGPATCGGCDRPGRTGAGAERAWCRPASRTWHVDPHHSRQGPSAGRGLARHFFLCFDHQSTGSWFSTNRRAGTRAFRGAPWPVIALVLDVFARGGRPGRGPR